MKVARFGLRPQAGEFFLDLPEGAEVLALRSIKQHLVLFVQLDEKQKKVPRRFYLVGDGTEFDADSDLDYAGGGEVSGTSWHLFAKLFA